MLENDEMTFVEEGEDILDGLEMTVNDGERTCCWTALRLSHWKDQNILKAGDKAAGSDKRRASIMKKRRELLAGKKNMRKPEGSINRGSGSGKVYL